MRALRRALSHLAMVSVHVRVHGLNCAAGLVAEVQGALVLPLGLTSETAVETKRFARWIDGLKAAQAASGGHVV
jgi:alkylhydroperoxidase/carboxymuconolactone decarboxylase family protein YurZ